MTLLLSVDCDVAAVVNALVPAPAGFSVESAMAFAFASACSSL